MTDLSPRLSLPFLQAGQAQKEIYHNEALTLLDMAVQATAQASEVNDPPAAPTEGQCWIVGAAPTGAWLGQAGALAGWTGGGWRFLAPVEGMVAWVIADRLWARRAGGAWILGDLPASSVTIGGAQVVGARQPAIAAPTGGAAADEEARAVIGSILAALQAHGLIAT